ncbi:hypothetical protein CEXT_656691 [Caerostris extrusa]|uniref:Uncharacterized protein n=1 Tax=Caerostris extrusa TaxID=172846 RepID=A0AAV4XEK1_CAEEX|nr:hypothetical protein CEXT_656691 [Caerostris extrusa]
MCYNLRGPEKRTTSLRFESFSSNPGMFISGGRMNITDDVRLAYKTLTNMAATRLFAFQWVCFREPGEFVRIIPHCESHSNANPFPTSVAGDSTGFQHGGPRYINPYLTETIPAMFTWKTDVKSSLELRRKAQQEDWVSIFEATNCLCSVA